MKQLIISALTLLCFAQGVLASDRAIDYAKVLSLTIDYDSADGGDFVVILKNSSTEKLQLILNDEEIEGKFSIEGGEDKVYFYDKDYLRKHLTSYWFPGHCELDGDAEIKWTARLEQLVWFYDTPVTPQSIAGESVSLSLDRLAVLSAVGNGNIPVKIQSNTLEIPKIDKTVVDKQLPAPAPEDIAHGITVPGRPGFVKSPYKPEAGLVDVRGIEANTKAEDPYTGRVFLVPEISNPSSTNTSE